MVVRSVLVSRPTAAEVCDFCGGVATLKITNRAFFILITCDSCWADLKRHVDEYALGASPSAQASGGAGG